MATLLHHPRIRRYLDRHFLCAVPEKPECLALSFDDGPNPRNTPPLLDLLASKGIPATFFVVGRWLERYGEIAARAHEEGHLLANHSDSHLPLSFLPPAWVRREIDRTNQRIAAITGHRPRFFRPPMGWFGPRLLRLLDQLEHVPVLGVAHPQDSKSPPVEVILERVRPRLEPGGILIFHDGGWRAGVDRSHTLEAVDRLTDECLEAGRRFVTVETLAAGTRWDSSGGNPMLRK